MNLVSYSKVDALGERMNVKDTAWVNLAAL
jgi:hypothetical protein